jgi:hypothetical protein
MKLKHILTGILLVFGVIFCTCESNKNEGDIVSDLTVVASGSPEGINLYLGNIPKDTIYLFVGLRNITTNDQLSTLAPIHGNELEYLKNTGFLVCPFVINGHEYEISVASYTGKEDYVVPFITTAIANGGIYLKNNLSLFWNNENNIVKLSEIPIFSDKEIYSQNIPFEYSLNIKTGENMSMGFGDISNELTFDFSQLINKNIEDHKDFENFQLIGNLPVFADVLCRLEYEKISWSVRFARTEEFIYSF